MDWLKEIWELARTAGPFATCLLLYLYVDQVKERRELSAKLSTMLERSTEVIADTKTTLEQWLVVFERARHRK